MSIAKKEHTKTYGVKKAVITIERDIYDKLERKPNKSGYIKSLIRKDIAESEPPKKITVRLVLPTLNEPNP